MVIKRLLLGLSLTAAGMAGFSGCGDALRVVYNGPEYIMFADTLSYFPVQNSEAWYAVPVASTVACDYDRTFGVEVIDPSSNAVENTHYVLESNTLTIKAGERATALKIRGIYENIGISDSLAVTFRLVGAEDARWDLYGNTTRVELMKSCPFDLNAFTGYCKLTSTYFNSYMINTDLRLLETEADSGAESTTVVHDFFYKGFDIRLKFDPSDPLKPFVEMEEQLIGYTAEAFGTIYGDGKMWAYQPMAYVSYYNVCQNFVLLYLTIYVKEVGVVGTYVNILEWISDEEAQQLKNEGY